MNRQIQSKLISWQTFFDSDTGKSLLESEKTMLDQLLASLHGDCLLQLGGPDDHKLLTKSPILHKIHMAKSVDGDSLQPDLCGTFDEIPLSAKSVDVVIVYHSLELENAPDKMMAEVYRVLKGEGTVIMLSFHTYSLWGLQHLWKKQGPPWDGHFYSTFKLQQLLSHAGFIKEKHKTSYFRPCFSQKKTSQKFMFLEPFGQICWPFCGAVSILKAKKRLNSMTPLKDSLYESGLDVDSALPEPTARK